LAIPILRKSAAFLALSTAAFAHATTRTFYVDASRPAGGDGQSWANAINDLQIALDRIGTLTNAERLGNDFEFKVAQGTYRASEHRDSAFRCNAAIGSTTVLTIAGAYGGFQAPNPDARDFVATPTVLTADVNADDGPHFANRSDNCTTVFATGQYVNASRMVRNLQLSGLVLQGGHSTTKQPSALYAGTYNIWGRSPWYSVTLCALDNCTIRDNYGSAIASYENSEYALDLNLTRCTITDNTSPHNGGALRLGEYHSIRAQRCLFARNHAPHGGAVASRDFVVFWACTFADNSAVGNGGAIHQASDRWAGSTLDTCLFTNNTAGGYGGALAMELANIYSCTLVHNSAVWGGGAFLGADCVVGDSVFSLNSSTLAGSQLAGGDEAPVMTRVAVDGHALGIYFPFSAAQPMVGPGLLPWEAQFIEPLGPDGNARTWLDNNYRLHPRSPLVDALYYEGGTVDLDSNPRPASGRIGSMFRADPGCYESQLSLCTSDINADGGVTVDDLLDFLEAFEAGHPFADLSNAESMLRADGGVTVEDLLVFLDKFAQGC
jgi:predicted outer membrane repeat protein